MDISYQNALTNLDGLSGLTHIGGSHFYIGNNWALTNIDGLFNLTDYEGPFLVYDNPELCQEYVDEATGQRYAWNEATGESTWL